MLHFIHICYWIFIVINASYWIFIFARLITFEQRKRKELSSLRVDVIVVFQNELKNLEKLIPNLLQQNLQSFHIHLQDDFSNEGEKEWIESLQEKRIKYVATNEQKNGKKQALKEALNLSEADVVLLTDADCLPVSDSWAISMIQTMTKDCDIVLGYSPIKKTSGMLNLFSRFETWITAIQYMGYALIKLPYMGVGRNLMYRRKLAVNFAPDTSLSSGDDDLFVQAVANKSNVHINLDPDAFVETDSKNVWFDFINQKRRHVRTSTHYKPIHQLLLGIFGMSQILIYGLGIIVIFSLSFTSFWWAYFLLLCLKMIIALPIMKRMKEHSLWIYFPLLDVLLSIYFCVLGLLMLFKPYKNW